MCSCVYVYIHLHIKNIHFLGLEGTFKFAFFKSVGFVCKQALNPRAQLRAEVEGYSMAWPFAIFPSL